MASMQRSAYPSPYRIRLLAKLGLEWVVPGFLPKAPLEGPKQDPKGKGRSQGKRRMPCGRGIKVMVPLR